MTEPFGEAGVAISLMKEALTLLGAPEAALAAQLLRQAIEAAKELRDRDARSLGFPFGPAERMGLHGARAARQSADKARAGGLFRARGSEPRSRSTR